MFEMFNIRDRTNQILAGLFMLSWVVFMVAGVVLMLGGTKTSDLFDSDVILVCCVGMATFGGLLMLLVAIQDCWRGETSYTAKGQLLKSDSFQQTFEVLTKTAVRSKSPWRFWTVVLAKAFAGLLLSAPLAILAASFVVRKLPARLYPDAATPAHLGSEGSVGSIPKGKPAMATGG